MLDTAFSRAFAKAGIHVPVSETVSRETEPQEEVLLCPCGNPLHSENYNGLCDSCIQTYGDSIGRSMASPDKRRTFPEKRFTRGRIYPLESDLAKNYSGRSLFDTGASGIGAWGLLAQGGCVDKTHAPTPKPKRRDTTSGLLDLSKNYRPEFIKDKQKTHSPAHCTFEDWASMSLKVWDSRAIRLRPNEYMASLKESFLQCECSDCTALRHTDPDTCPCPECARERNRRW